MLKPTVLPCSVNGPLTHAWPRVPRHWCFLVPEKTLCVLSSLSISSGKSRLRDAVRWAMMNTSFSKFQFFLKVQIESLVTVLSLVFLEGRDLVHLIEWATVCWCLSRDDGPREGVMAEGTVFAAGAPHEVASRLDNQHKRLCQLPAGVEGWD